MSHIKSAEKEVCGKFKRYPLKTAQTGLRQNKTTERKLRKWSKTTRAVAVLVRWQVVLVLLLCCRALQCVEGGGVVSSFCLYFFFFFASAGSGHGRTGLSLCWRRVRASSPLICLSWSEHGQRLTSRPAEQAEMRERGVARVLLFMGHTYPRVTPQGTEAVCLVWQWNTVTCTSFIFTTQCQCCRK